MKRSSTIILKIAVCLIGMLILALYIFWLPGLANIMAEMASEFAYRQYLFFIGVYAAGIPFYFALHQTLKLLSYIDKNKAFSELSVKALKNIKYAANAISILYLLEMPLLFFIAQEDDAPGIIVLGLVIILGSSVIAVFAAVLEKLLKDAIDIKMENDLTV